MRWLFKILKNRANAAQALIDNWSQAEKATEAAKNSAGTAEKENEVYMESIDGKVAQLQAKIQQLATDFTNSDFMKGLVDGASGFLNLIDMVVSKLGSIPTLLSTISGAMTFVSTIKNGRDSTIAGSFLNNVLYGKNNYAFAQNVLNNTSDSTSIEGMSAAIKLAQKGTGQLSKSVSDMVESFKDGTTGVSDFRAQLQGIPVTTNMANSSFNALKSTVSNVGNVLKNVALNVGTSLLTAGVTLAISAGISFIANAIDKYVNRVKYAKQEMESAFSDYETKNTEYEDAVSKLEENKTEIAELEQKTNGLTEAEQERLSQLKESTKELEAQAYWADQIRNGSAIEAAEKSVDAFQKEYGTVNTSGLDDDDAKERAFVAWQEETGNNFDSFDFWEANYWNGITDIEDEIPDISKFKTAQEELEEIINNNYDYENDSAYKSKKNEIDELTKSLSTEASTLEGYIESWDKLPDSQKPLFQDYYDKAVEYRDEIQKILDPDAWKKTKITDVLDEYSDSFESDLKSITDAEGDTQISTKKLEKAFPGLTAKINKAGISTKDFVKYLNTSVLASDSATEATEDLAKSYSDVTENASSIIESFETVTGYLGSLSLSESFSVDEFNSDAFQELFKYSGDNKNWDEYGEYVEMVNGVLTVNTDLVKKNTQALADQKVEEAVTSKRSLQKEYLQNTRLINEYTKALGDSSYAIYKGKTITQSSISALQEQNATIAKQCDGLDLYISNIKEATGVYKAWVDAQSQSDTGEMFDQSVSAAQKIKNTYTYGTDEYLKTGKGAKQYNAAFDYLISDEIAQKNGIDRTNIDSVQAYMDSIGYLFTKNSDGEYEDFNIEGFLQQAVSSGMMKVNENDEYEINGEMTMHQFANGMNLGLPAVQSIFAELEEYPNNFTWADEDISKLFDNIATSYAKLQSDTGLGNSEGIQSDQAELEKYAKEIANLDAETRKDFGIDVDIEDGDWQAVIDWVNSYYNSLTEAEQEALANDDALSKMAASASTAQSTLSTIDDSYVTKGVTTDDMRSMNLETENYDQALEDMESIKKYIDEIDESDLDPTVKTEEIAKANEMLEYSQKRISQLANSGDLHINMDVTDVDKRIGTLRDTLDELKDSNGTISLDSTEALSAYNEMQMLLSIKQSLNQPTVMNIDASQSESEVGQAIQKIQDYQEAVNNLNVLNGLKAEGFDIDTSTIDAAETKVQNLQTEIAGLSSETQTKIGIDVTATTSKEDIANQIQNIDATAVVKLDDSLVQNFKNQDNDTTSTHTVNIDITRVTSFVDAAAGRAYDTKSTHTVEVQTVGNINAFTSKNSSASGSQSVNGTAHISGTAHASGNWGTKKTETALVGELGREILVDGNTGTWQTIGDNGAEFRRIPANSIIFNHKQTEDLLKNGYVTSRGKTVKGSSWLSGNAYIGGGISAKLVHQRALSDASSSTEATESASDAAESASEAASSASEAASSASEATEEFSEMVDWIETKIDRIERVIENIGTIAESEFNTYSKRNDAVMQKMSKLNEEISIQQQAYDRYMQQANSVGLSEDYAQKVRDGLIDIEEITDEDLKDKIDDYQEWLTS